MSGPPLAPYLAPPARRARFEATAGRAGASLERFGESVEARALTLARLPARASDAEARPWVLVVANIHGPEFIGHEVAHAFLAAAGDGAGHFGALREAANLGVVPCLNPDGYARTWSAEGRGALAELRANARGVDLNRNFPLPEGERRWPIPGSGSGRPGAATYYGEGPASEPETAALCRLVEGLRPHAVFGLHSFMGSFIPARVRSRDAYKNYKGICAAMRAAQTSAGYRRLASRHFDVFTGEQEDWMHHVADAWALCLESFPVRASFGQHLRAPSLFWRFNPREPAPWVAQDTLALAAGALHALGLPRPSELG